MRPGRPGVGQGSPAMIVNACPDFDRLLRFLESPSPGVDDEAIAVHVEKGPPSAGPSWSGWPRRSSSPHCEPPGPSRSAVDLAFLGDLKGLDLSHLSEPPAPRRGGIPAARSPRL